MEPFTLRPLICAEPMSRPRAIYLLIIATFMNLVAGDTRPSFWEAGISEKGKLDLWLHNNSPRRFNRLPKHRDQETLTGWAWFWTCWQRVTAYWSCGHMRMCPQPSHPSRHTEKAEAGEGAPVTGTSQSIDATSDRKLGYKFLIRLVNSTECFQNQSPTEVRHH